ncbi:ATP/maltotriose-dependent transcriptional regulator MalT [Halanaerobium saccharolyticum]|uniref:ATP/maltotriose-dependent transcriptional regulator MalT n=1 Tax=Halanaerobium saccharolyticum TaxID=43595 RepID=A0A4R6SJK0_9FIRM|nr:LuxR C-terminal-related transcriptional regulator [Halanaerobium saccharolyticum]TDQ03974.1 ATP/maltotriose-dependent transcriptional regulator MalT [Halanaerobium saccharolyticum]
MDLLMEFQTQIPQLNNIYRRKRLLSALNNFNENNEGSLALITAPAGFGKTTLIADWLDFNNQSAAWLSLDNNLKSSFQFIRGIIAAFKKNSEADFLNTETILKLPLNLNPQKTAFSLIKDLKNIAPKTALIIDNLDLSSEDFIFEFLKYLIKFIPTNLKLILISRKEIPILIKRQDLKGELIKIKEADLKFSYLELKKLIQQENELNLADDKIQKIYQVTEGWPLAVELLMVKLLEDAEYNFNYLEAEFGLPNNNLFQYLNQEVFSKLAAAEKEFLLKSSVVESFSAELAARLSSVKDIEALIDKLVKKKIFIEAVDHKNYFYRYYSPFRKFLRSQLKAEEKAELNLKAAAWFAEHDYYQEAVLYSLRAKDYQLALDYLEKSVPAYFKAGELQEFLNLAEQIPAEDFKDSPPLLIIKALSLFILGKKEDAAYYLSLVENTDNLSLENRGRLLTLSSFMEKYQDADLHCSKTAEALNLIPESDYIFKINALMTLGQIQSSYSKIDQSIDSFRQAAFLAREKEQYLMEINSLMNLTLKLTQQGNLNQALNLSLESIERFQNKKVAAELVNLLSIPLGIIYYFRAEYKRSRVYLLKGIEAGEFFELIHVYWLPMIYYALSTFYLGQTDEAEEIIAETLELCKKYNLKVNYQLAEMEKLNFELYKGDINSLNQLLKKKIKAQTEIIDQQIFFVIRVRALFLVTELLLAEKKYQQALNFLKKIDYEKLDYQYQIKSKIIKAIIYLKLADKNKSRDLLIDALLMLEKENYLTVLTEYKKYLKILLTEFKELKQKINIKFDFIIPEKSPTQNAEKLIDPLTDREKEIIVLLAEGLSNKKIAEKLFITEGTTKWHLSNIYSKLAVPNRTRAAAKARKLNII